MLAHFRHRKSGHLCIMCLEARGPFQTAEAHEVIREASKVSPTASRD